MNREKINQILETLPDEVKRYIEEQTHRVEKLNTIGTALSSESDLNKLLEMILVQAKEFTHADGGTLYLMSQDEKELMFTVVQTDSLNIRMGGTQGEIQWSPLSLYCDDGSQNRQMVAVICALDGKVINIPDVYDAEGFNFEGTRRFDKSTGYRSRSMLVVPMRNHKKEIIGVLQLINRQHPDTPSTIAFSQEDEEMTLSLASQAAVAITNAQLVHDLENLLKSFIQSIAEAIDEKSPYTGGHIRRVAELTMMIAEAINRTEEGKYGKVAFDEDQLKELYYSAWMHDVGKIATPEFVVDKATKLETIHDRIETVETRIEVMLRDLEISLLKEEITADEYDREKHSLVEIGDFLRNVNVGGEYMNEKDAKKVREIAQRTWQYRGKTLRLLDTDEIKNLTIAKGTLTETERDKITAHASVGMKMLSSLPFPKKLRNVPDYAAKHHEKLSGKGYPLGLHADQIPLEARILALADIFEALTAADRPYKKAKTLEEADRILSFMVKDGELDADLVSFFFEKELHLQ